VSDEAYYERPIKLRNPVVFYEGHLPAFAVNTLLKRALGEPGIDEQLEQMFARGIDPDEETQAVARGNPLWPTREVVRQYGQEADRRLCDVLERGEIDRDGHPLLAGAEAVWTILEHEEMHQETLAYIWHQMPYAWKRPPDGYATAVSAPAETPDRGTRRVPEGTATLGTPVGGGGFGWDNERPARQVRVRAFDVDVDNVTNAAFLRFVEDGGYEEPRWWRAEDWTWVQDACVGHPPFWRRVDGSWQLRGMFESVPLPMTWPVYVTWAEAHAFAAWRGRRMLREAEYHRAAYGTSSGRERRYPWGDTMPVEAPANFDFQRWDPEPVGQRHSSMSAFGINDLVGNGWEWTADPFRPFEGFTPMASYPEYSVEFFDDQHFVMKGASPVTDRHLVRPGFRNWFRPRYPYVYATFRTVGG
jgi:ergothioneine biosynthesis protein EgtB